MPFQTAYLVTDRGGCYMQLAGSAREAQQTGGGLEGAQRSQGRQRPIRHEFLSREP
jgi:hypothetical protein